MFGSRLARRSRSSHVCAMTHYEVLQVPVHATSAQIKTQYYKLCKVLHPDAKRHPTARSETPPVAFHQLTEAYETLRNEERRRAYDRSMALTSHKRVPFPASDIWHQQSPMRRGSHEHWIKLARSPRRFEDEQKRRSRAEEQRREDDVLMRMRMFVICTVSLSCIWSYFQS